MSATPDVIVYADPDAVAEATAARLLLRIGDVLAHRDRADIVLTGGTVGIATLAAAAKSPLAQAIDWTSVHVWWGDERYVASGHEDRNEGQAQEALLSHIPLPEENIHRVGSSDDFSSPEESAQAYADALSANGDPAFDVLLLGLGPDGHVASLFPDHPSYSAADASDASTSAKAVHGSPKPPPLRVSLTLSAINRAREVWVVATGAPKAEVIGRCLSGDTTLPGASVRGTERTLWLVDAAGATRI